ncbi:unnamed protein product [Anisakis simplex]|uniref:Uncharacterized protein n=1 Tax=Anisakis simplex TaxID=6269 RepID=A0A0M3JBZ8_ANISI|nr:unnamed protein product [Anisakis simplex]
MPKDRENRCCGEGVMPCDPQESGEDVVPNDPQAAPQLDNLNGGQPNDHLEESRDQVDGSKLRAFRLPARSWERSLPNGQLLAR